MDINGKIAQYKNTGFRSVLTNNIQYYMHTYSHYIQSDIIQCLMIASPRKLKELFLSDIIWYKQAMNIVSNL